MVTLLACLGSIAGILHTVASKSPPLGAKAKNDDETKAKSSEKRSDKNAPAAPPPSTKRKLRKRKLKRKRSAPAAASAKSTAKSDDAEKEADTDEAKNEDVVSDGAPASSPKSIDEDTDDVAEDEVELSGSPATWGASTAAPSPTKAKALGKPSKRKASSKEKKSATSDGMSDVSEDELVMPSSASRKRKKSGRLSKKIEASETQEDDAKVEDKADGDAPRSKKKARTEPPVDVVKVRTR